MVSTNLKSVDREDKGDSIVQGKYIQAIIFNPFLPIYGIVMKELSMPLLFVAP